MSTKTYQAETTARSNHRSSKRNYSYAVVGQSMSYSYEAGTTTYGEMAVLTWHGDAANAAKSLKVLAGRGFRQLSIVPVQAR